MSGLLTEQFVWIAGAGLAMSAIALVGGLALLLPADRMRRLLLPMVALSAGTLLGGAFFHLIPAAVDRLGNRIEVYMAVVAGFTLFFVLEQFLNWHHCHESPCHHRPITYLILAADGLHNFIGGLAVGGAFLIDVRLGISAWIAAAAHEVPQELGDFAVLVHGGWRPTRALLFNVLSAVTFLFGGLTAYATAQHIDVTMLLPFAAGNFLYIAGADLIPEIKGARNARPSATHFLAFTAGLALLLGVRFVFE